MIDTAHVPYTLTQEQVDSIGSTIDFDKPWRLGMEVFNGKRLEQDRDMVEEITKILRANGHPDPEAWAKNDEIIMAKPMPPEGQIFIINRYWRLFLGEKELDTMTVRRALIDIVASYSDYLRLFDKAVAPYVIPEQPAEQPESQACPVV